MRKYVHVPLHSLTAKFVAYMSLRNFQLLLVILGFFELDV